MSRVRGRDTKPELILRRGLHALGMRFRLHVPYLPGKPDIVFSRRKVVIFVNGCFWHRHDCPRSKLPVTRRDFWERKISANVERDLRTQARLLTEGWRVLVVWECPLRGHTADQVQAVIEEVRQFILADKGPSFGEIPNANGNAKVNG